MKTNARLYVMRANDGMLKLGHSKNPLARAKDVGRKVDVVYQSDVIEHAERIERMAHRVLAMSGGHKRGEWFFATVDQAIAAIAIAIKQFERSELELGKSLKCRSSLDGAILVPVRFPPHLLEIIDAEAGARLDKPSRSAVIRDLVVDGLRAVGWKQEAIAARKRKRT